MTDVKSSGFGNACLINYTKSGKPFWCEISVQSIVSKDSYGNNQVTHFVATVTKNDDLDLEKNSFNKISEGVLASRKQGSKSLSWNKFTSYECFQLMTSLLDFKMIYFLFL